MSPSQGMDAARSATRPVELGDAVRDARIAFVQYGDYRETVHRFEVGGGETYYAQRYSVEAVAQLVPHVRMACVLCLTAGPYDEMLPNGVRAVGLPVRHAGRRGRVELLRLLASLDPTHLIARTPRLELIRFALRHGSRLLPMLADSLAPSLRPRRWLRQRRLVHGLNQPEIPWVANHNVNAARSLERLGVDPAKTVPWDWPPVARPEQHPIQSAPAEPGRRSMLFVGVHCEDKGLGDAIDALARLAADGHDLRLTCIGPGDSEPFRRRAEARGVGHAVQFLGRLEHPRVLEQMRQHDAVLVPSRHVYAEGLPMTLYDAYSSRTPLLASDHPMFRDKVEHGFSGLCFRAGDPADLARRVRELFEEPGLYRRLSANAEEAFRRIECPAKWAELVYRWLRDAPEDRRWLGRHALAPAQEVSHSDRTRHKAA